MTSADQRQQIASDRVDQQAEHLGDRIGAGGQPRQKFRRMPLGEEGDAFAHQLGEQPALVVGEDGVADLRQDHVMAVGRRALEDEDHDGDAGQDRDAADVLVDIGLVDDLAEQIGRAGGGRRRDRHQRERHQIAPPIGGSLFRDQAANQDRRAIGIVGDFLRKFGHPRSIDGARQASARASGLLRNVRLLARYIGVFQAKSGLARGRDFRPRPRAAARHGARGTASLPTPARARRWSRDRRIAASSPASRGCGWCRRSWS